jgi:peptide/nickel transport system permease protein
MVSEARGVDSALPDSVREVESPGSLSQRQLELRRFSRHRLAVASVFALFILCALAAFAEVFAPYGVHERHLDYAYAPPQSVHFDLKHGVYTYALSRYVDPVTFRKQYVELPSEPLRLRFFQLGEPYRLWGLIPLRRHLLSVSRETGDLGAGQKTVSAEPTFFVLGADRYGQDIFSRSVYGARVSLSVGVLGLACSFILGVVIGVVSGYAGGGTDGFIQRGSEIVEAFPALPLWIALTALLPGSWPALAVYCAISVLLSLSSWTAVARVVRGKIRALRGEEYAVAARLMGASHARILFRHVVPGFTSHILAALTLCVPAVILGETALSCLGLGLRPPLVSWGVMLQDCLDVKAVRLHPWLLSPIVFIVALTLSFNFLGDGLRDAAKPRR